LFVCSDLKTISKFAQLEYKLGEPERGKTLFEGIVDTHPKRWDIWSIYIDMEAGQNDMQSIRFVQSSITTDLSPHYSTLLSQKPLRSCAFPKNDEPQSQVSQPFSHLEN